MEGIFDGLSGILVGRGLFRTGVGGSMAFNAILGGLRLGGCLRLGLRCLLGVSCQ